MSSSFRNKAAAFYIPADSVFPSTPILLLFVFPLSYHVLHFNTHGHASQAPRDRELSLAHPAPQQYYLPT
jgi:hypothetical protein